MWKTQNMYEYQAHLGTLQNMKIVKLLKLFKI